MSSTSQKSGALIAFNSTAIHNKVWQKSVITLVVFIAQIMLTQATSFEEIHNVYYKNDT